MHCFSEGRLCCDNIYTSKFNALGNKTFISLSRSRPGWEFQVRGSSALVIQWTRMTKPPSSFQGGCGHLLPRKPEGRSTNTHQYKNSSTWPHQTARETGKWSLAVCQEEEEKEFWWTAYSICHMHYTNFYLNKIKDNYVSSNHGLLGLLQAFTPVNSKDLFYWSSYLCLISVGKGKRKEMVYFLLVISYISSYKLSQMMVVQFFFSK